MEAYLWILLLITLFTGLFGGLINVLGLPKKKAISSGSPSIENSSANKEVWHTLLIAIGASFVVPLFLQTISSNLIDQCKEDPKYYFTYAGFCIIAALFSRRFLSTVADRVLKTAENAEKIAQAAIDQVEENTDLIQPMIIENSDQKNEPAEVATSEDTSTLKGNSSDEENVRDVLKARKYVYRTARGIAKEISLEPTRVEEILNSLEKQGQVNKFENKDKSKTLWTLKS